MANMPTTRAKGRFPDIEDALLNWARSWHKSKSNPSECEIRNKALALFTALGCSKAY
jgi:hypothetical protein